MAEKKLEHILFLRDTAPSLPSPCRVKVASTDGDEPSELELVPSYFFDEDNDSMELDLIPQIFLVENDDVDSLRSQSEEFATPEMLDFSELNQIKIDEALLSILYNTSDCVDCCSDDTRCLFDRGKYAVISLISSEKFLPQLLHNLGYASNFRFINLIALSCANFVELHGELRVLVQIPVRGRFLFLLFARVITIDISYEHLTGSKEFVVHDRKLNCKDYVTSLFDYARSLFDRGKDIELGLRTSCFTECTEIMSPIDVYLKFLERYFRISIPALIHEQGVSSTQLLDKMFEIDIVCLKSKSVSSVKSLIDSRVFDRGKDIGPINGCSAEFSLDLTASCLFVLHDCPILRNANNGNFVYELFFRHGFQFHSFSMNYILLAFTNGDISDVYLWCFQMMEMWSAIHFLLRLQYGLCDEISVPLVVIQIHMESFECFSEFIMFMLHQGFSYLQPCILFHIVLWLPMDQLTWCNQLAGTCVFVSHDTSQMIHVIIPAVAARCEFMGNLAESVMLRWNCGNDDFVLRLTLGQSLRRGTDITTSEFCVNTLDEGMQVYPYPVDLRSPYYAGLTSYGCCRLLRLSYHTMRGYIKFDFLGEVVRTQSWVTMYYTPHVLVCVDAHILLKLLTLNSAKVYFVIYTIMLIYVCSRIPTTEYIRLIFDRGKYLKPVASSVFDRYISKFYFTSCLIVHKGLFFMDACASKYAHESMLEIGHHLVLQFGILHVFGFVINGEKCAASQRVNEMLQLDYILWSTREESVGMSTYPTGGVDNIWACSFPWTTQHHQVQGNYGLYRRNSCLVVISLDVYFADSEHVSRDYFYLLARYFEAAATDAYRHVPAQERRRPGSSIHILEDKDVLEG